MENTAIAWCNHTFNPWEGCQRASPGCENCYAETRDRRFTGGKHWGPNGVRRVTSASNWHQPRKWNTEAEKAGKRARVFCASLADVFEDRPELVEPRARLFALIAETPWLDWLLLTKRPENMVRLAPAAWADGWPANVWAGTTVEDQRRADERIPLLLEVPARVRFLSMEPLLEAVALGEWIERYDHCSSCATENEPQDEDQCPECGKTGTLISTWGDAQAQRYRSGERHDPDSEAGRRDMDEGPGISWIIVGGESGPRARPFDFAWARSVVAQCKAADVPVFVKQLGARPIAERDDATPIFRDRSGADPAEWPDDLRVREWPLQVDTK